MLQHQIRSVDGEHKKYTIIDSDLFLAFILFGTLV